MPPETQQRTKEERAKVSTTRGMKSAFALYSRLLEGACSLPRGKTCRKLFVAPCPIYVYIELTESNESNSIEFVDLNNATENNVVTYMYISRTMAERMPGEAGGAAAAWAGTSPTR